MDVGEGWKGGHGTTALEENRNGYGGSAQGKSPPVGAGEREYSERAAAVKDEKESPCGDKRYCRQARHAVRFFCSLRPA